MCAFYNGFKIIIIKCFNKVIFSSKRLRQLLIAIPIQFFQILNQNCTLFIDWVNLSSEILPELKCAPQIHARIDTKFSQKFASLNYSFNISSSLNGWPSAKYLESALERGFFVYFIHILNRFLNLI